VSRRPTAAFDAAEVDTEPSGMNFFRGAPASVKLQICFALGAQFWRLNPENNGISIRPSSVLKNSFARALPSSAD